MVDGSFTLKFEKAMSDVEVKVDVAKVGKTSPYIVSSSPDKNSSANLSLVCMIS
ncbi:hypothetical protein BCR42DRAFT_429501 [Absidia repens]|uniref:Uncharacterized protein n=1 Tax=Absidia repens TaxID=90262 RepID=A0A1X2HWX7_9FUNG|nr:hypothetical protein BCR42DRAFT_429501 [Absidia repens]